MASRLSSLLVRDGLVGVKRMEKAFQRQVIYGGSLDTILLEMGLVPDERLGQYLALASGLPPASRAECNVFDVEAVKRCPEPTAHKFKVVPLGIDADALRVLVCEPVDMAALEELADEIDVPIQPLIVPEYRWHVVYATVFGVSAPARFTTLAKQIDAAPVTPPVGKARTVIVEPADAVADSGTDHVVVDVKDVPTAPTGPTVVRASAVAAAAFAVPLRPVGPEANTLRMAAVAPPADEPADEPAEPPVHARANTAELSSTAYAEHLEHTETARRDAEARRRPTTPAPPVAVAEPAREAEPDVAPAPPQRTTAPGHAVAEPPTPREGTPVWVAPPAEAEAVIVAPAVPADGAHDHAPMSPVVAREALMVAEDRDRIFMILLRALRSRARWAGLLTVQGGAVIGRLAIAEHGADVSRISSVLIPLDSPSAFRTSVTAQRPHVGPLATGDFDVDSMLLRLGGVLPPSALLLPIVLRDRVVALAIAHRMDAPLGLADVAELLPLAGAAADALGRLIVKHKAGGYRAPAPTEGVVQVSVDDVETKRGDRPRAAASWQVPTAPTTATIDVAPEPAPPPPRRPAIELVDALDGRAEGAAEDLFTEAVERAAEIVPLLAARFPGKLRVDRYQVSGRPLRAAQYGALLELAVRIGTPATDVLVEKMSDPHRDVRFYATVCAAELRPRSAVYALVERLFDADYGVRASAIEALNGYPLRDLDTALARARHALHSEDPERVLAAANAVAELGDVHAIPDLLDTVSRDARRAEHARRALVALSKQDFGTSERKWRRWWDDHRKQHRIEWLIEGLVHKDLPIRQSAAEDLRRLTGEHFGYHPDLPRRDRELSQERWTQWWGEVGRRRFARDDDERLRPTAMLPRKLD